MRGLEKSADAVRLKIRVLVLMVTMYYTVRSDKLNKCSNSFNIQNYRECPTVCLNKSI